MASRLWLYSNIGEWAMIILSTIVAFVLSDVNPDFHHFSILDLSISYPYRSHQKINKALLILVSVIFPAVAIILVSLIGQGSRSLHGRYPTRLDSLNTSLLGLGVSLATTTVVVTGVKNLTGKPRPNFLDVCQPDLSRILPSTVGGYGQSISNLWVLVDGGICRQSDRRLLKDGFRSFPSGYAAAAFAGLWYLTLFMSAKFTILPRPHSSPSTLSETDGADSSVLLSPPGQLQPTGDVSVSFSSRKGRRAYFLPILYTPLGLAIFIAGTRYFDFTNHGFDVIAGAGVGMLASWFGFRWYHPSLM